MDHIDLPYQGEKRLPPHMSSQVAIHPDGSFLVADTRNKLLLWYQWNYSSKHYNIRKSTSIDDNISTHCFKAALDIGKFALQNGTNEPITTYPECENEINGKNRAILGSTPEGKIICRECKPEAPHRECQVITILNPEDGTKDVTLYCDFPCVWSWGLKVCSDYRGGYAVADEYNCMLDIIQVHDGKGNIKQSIPLDFTPKCMASSKDYIFIAQRSIPSKMFVYDWSCKHIHTCSMGQGVTICGLAHGMDRVLHVAYEKSDSCCFVRAYDVSVILTGGVDDDRHTGRSRSQSQHYKNSNSDAASNNSCGRICVGKTINQSAAYAHSLQNISTCRSTENYTQNVSYNCPIVKGDNFDMSDESCSLIHEERTLAGTAQNAFWADSDSNEYPTKSSKTNNDPLEGSLLHPDGYNIIRESNDYNSRPSYDNSQVGELISQSDSLRFEEHNSELLNSDNNQMLEKSNQSADGESLSAEIDECLQIRNKTMAIEPQQSNVMSARNIITADVQVAKPERIIEPSLVLPLSRETPYQKKFGSAPNIFTVDFQSFKRERIIEASHEPNYKIEEERYPLEPLKTTDYAPKPNSPQPDKSCLMGESYSSYVKSFPKVDNDELNSQSDSLTYEANGSMSITPETHQYQMPKESSHPVDSDVSESDDDFGNDPRTSYSKYTYATQNVFTIDVVEEPLLTPDVACNMFTVTPHYAIKDDKYPLEPFKSKDNTHEHNSDHCTIGESNDHNSRSSYDESDMVSTDVLDSTIPIKDTNDDKSVEVHLNDILNCMDKRTYSRLRRMLKEQIYRDCINRPNKLNGRNLLFSAVMLNDPTLLKMFLENGADVNIQDVSGNTPLHVATLWRRTNIIQALLQDKRIKPNTTNKISMAPLFFCQTLECLKLLVGRVDINVKDQDGDTLLCSYAKLDKSPYDSPLDMMKFLLQHDADPNLVNNDEYTPLHAALFANDIEKVRCLISNPKADVYAQDSKGNTYLHHTVMLSNEVATDMTKMFLDGGVDPSTVSSDGQTPLHVLLKCNKDVNLDIAKLLVQNKPTIVNIADNNKNTCFHLVAERIHPGEILNLLFPMAEKATLTRTNDEGKTPLDVALEKRNAEYFTCIMNLGAFDISDENGNTLLHFLSGMSIEHASLKSIHTRNPHLINCSNNTIETPLMIACRKGHLGVVESLLLYDADLETISDENGTALNITIENQNYGILEAILTKDQTLLNKPCFKSRWPLLQAIKYRQSNAVKIMLDIYEKNFQLRKEFVDCLNNSDPNTVSTLYLDDLIDAIKQQETEVVMPFVDSCMWKEIFEHESEKLETTPFKEAVEYIPDVAIAILNKCVGDKPLKQSSNKDQEKPTRNEQVQGGHVYFGCIRNPELSSGYEQKILQQICKGKSEGLVDHPVFRMLIRRKWGATLGLYSIFLLLFVVHICLGYSYMFVLGQPGLNSTLMKSNTTSHRSLSYALYCTSALGIAIEIFQLVSMGTNKSLAGYFKSIDNYMDWFCCSVMIYLVYSTQNGNVENWQWQLGVACLFVSSLNILYLLRVYPSFGIYTLMILLMMSNMLQFFAVIISIIFIFGISFHLLIPNQEAFATVPTSVVKNWVMMIGEMNFMEIFYSDENGTEFKIFTWVLYCFFLVFVSLVVMNLITSLAVIGVENLQIKSRQHITIAQCELTLRLDSMIPKSKSFLKKCLYPRDKGYLYEDFHKGKRLSNIWIEKQLYGQLDETSILRDIESILQRRHCNFKCTAQK